jgi:hypothetical protein
VHHEIEVLPSPEAVARNASDRQPTPGKRRQQHHEIRLARASLLPARYRSGPHVDREAWTVQFPPTLVTDYGDLTEDIAKIVGVSDDHDRVAAASSAAHQKFGDHVSATRSQPYYLDITHPHANKGTVVRYLAARYHLPAVRTARRMNWSINVAYPASGGPPLGGHPAAVRRLSYTRIG